MNTEPHLEQLIVEAATNFDLPEPESTLLLEFTTGTGDPGRANVATDYDNQVYLEGVFLSAKANTDIRFSSVEDMHRAVRDYQKQFVETGQSLSELRGASSWVAKPTPDPEKAALRVTELTIQPNGDVRGKAVLISPKLRALVLAGWRPVIRVRALGRQDQSGVIKAGFKIVAFDVSWSESPGRATLNAFGRAPATSTRLNESTTQQQQEPVTPATPSKQRLISPELLAEKFEQKFEQKKLNENRMREWISSVRNNTDFK